MDFEKAYQKFIDGTATSEEVEFVRGEMKKASEINNILSSVKKEGATNNAEKETVKKAMKSYRKKDTLKILLIVCSVVLVLAIGIGCSVGIPILTSAKSNLNYSWEEAQTIAYNYLIKEYPENVGKIEIKRVEKELEVEGRIKNARYIYVFDVYNGKNQEFEIEIDSKTGNIVDVD